MLWMKIVWMNMYAIERERDSFTHWCLTLLALPINALLISFNFELFCIITSPSSFIATPIFSLTVLLLFSIRTRRVSIESKVYCCCNCKQLIDKLWIAQFGGEEWKIWFVTSNFGLWQSHINISSSPL